MASLNCINQFKDEFSFLSNFYPAFVYYDSHIYPSVEHAYVAAKTDNQEHRRIIRETTSAADVKRYGRKLKLINGWEFKKLGIMYQLVEYKFSFDNKLKQLLLDTEDCELIEGNYWGDTYWGLCFNTGEGDNNLGRILMDVRENLRWVS